ncbi:hypothetical protein BO70DRAFT_398644 [Aspergillus heteromorphus CBS 117.55]|uniref:F-box domain-containing protein n=1 Tax=Aspergillus heteromorphus CBS 117.55 TaxID=1448321 RepID=A0A317VIT9_9EURO|nr:uncharacterized protein BO70DRAFT_398644 [Aspergillus heteromorphus CBS 117.55]PWY74314.1 hypothetical protein BO70DRAFT_398644 [Aspergillus heteromorphus CBS 117.55]
MAPVHSKPSRLLLLPAELLIEILGCIDDPKSLVAAIHSCQRLQDVFYAHRLPILRSILYSTLGPELVPYEALNHQVMHHNWGGDISVTPTEEDFRARVDLFFQPNYKWKGSAEQTVDMIRFHTLLFWFKEAVYKRFMNCYDASSDSDSRQRVPTSKNENHRIMRHLYIISFVLQTQIALHIKHGQQSPVHHWTEELLERFALNWVEVAQCRRMNASLYHTMVDHLRYGLDFPPNNPGAPGVFTPYMEAFCARYRNEEMGPITMSKDYALCHVFTSMTSDIPSAIDRDSTVGVFALCLTYMRNIDDALVSITANFANRPGRKRGRSGFPQGTTACQDDPRILKLDLNDLPFEMSHVLFWDRDRLENVAYGVWHQRFMDPSACNTLRAFLQRGYEA